ncbi:MAG: glycosyl transferase family 1 [Desulfuromonadales bacterium C00003096]|jgi:glycosyltransferase involved in cell wall biosynthesis|nr:MAG: glycosyl transferase family 1 [Desulfuromonadales bacterium C00003096]
MKLLVLEPYFTGSHAAWSQEYAARSRHRVEILSLPGRHWKWRMHGGAVTLARQFLENRQPVDLLLASAMLDLTTFLALTRSKSAGVPAVLYFHENQLTYPWSPRDSDPPARRDAHYGFINYASALAADRVLFNSHYHRQAFLEALPAFLGVFPDHQEMASIDSIAAKSQVLPLGLDLQRLDAHRPLMDSHSQGPPLLLWNHRWEYDKNPEEFFRALFLLQEQGLDFQVAILGESFAEQPAIFAEARRRLGERVVQFGYAADFADYARWLWRADILPVTAIHDFFGISVVQAMHCNCHPLLPKRLAYPEHVPQALHDDYFYDDFDGLVVRLAESIEQVAALRGRSVRPFVQDYDWGQLVGRYDELLADCLATPSGV